jgi:hypothetical protein
MSHKVRSRKNTHKRRYSSGGYIGARGYYNQGVYAGPVVRRGGKTKRRGAHKSRSRRHH